MSLHEKERASLKRALENQIRRLTARIAFYDRLDKRISLARLIVFIAGLVLIVLAVSLGSAWLLIIVLLTFLSGFITLVIRHRRLDGIRDKCKKWMEIRSRHLARMTLDWGKLPHSHNVEIDEHHPFARELDIIGKHSLLDLMDTTIFEGGAQKMAEWLTGTDPELSEIKRRRELVEELRPLSMFRDYLTLKAMQVQAQTDPYDWDMPTLFRWLAMAKGRSYLKPLIILGLLALTDIILLILYFTGVTGGFFILSFIVYLFVYNLNRDKITGLFDDASRMLTLLERFNNILEYLETYPYENGSRLYEFCEIYHSPDNRPSRYLGKIMRLAAAASSQENEILHAILNILMPWDLYFAHRINRYKSEIIDKLKPWLDRYYELEALCSIANFAWLNPDYIYPVIHNEGPPAIKAISLGHPLINRERKITNDVTINKTGTILLITGSNMAGKSTFLRTLGINLCLCFAGAPVNARSFETIPFRLFSSINVFDSLVEGLSHFYAEVKRLRSMLDQLDKPDQWPLFYLIDEIFRGTNNRERLIGSADMLKAMAGKRGIGVISSHDLELAQLDKEIPELQNWHFSETIENGRMSFNYKLTPGPCPTTNALKIMQMEGLPVKNSEQ